MRNFVITISVLFLINGCFNKVSDCKDLKSGTFELWENEHKIGKIYREGDYQFEKYFNSRKITIVKIRYDKCSAFFNFNTIKEPFDTITWRLDYKFIDKGYYSFEAKAAYIDLDYVYKGKLKKISNTISEKRIIEKRDSIFIVNKRFP